jgi:hypothetical protein
MGLFSRIWSNGQTVTATDMTNIGADLDAGLVRSNHTGTTPLSGGGTGTSLSDPNADRIMFWDDSAGHVDWLTPGTDLSITGTTLNGTGGDASTNTSASVVNEVALYADTTGKLLKRATGTGIAELTSGVQSIATAGTDYYAHNPGGLRS